jgi:haloalkane dehalogenase
VDVARAPDDAFGALPDFPFAPHWLDLDGLRMHYVDEGEGAPVLFLHGEPTWSFLWRHVIPEVVAVGRRAIAPDLIGFGRSDKPTEQGWYTYDRHVEAVTRLVLELDLRDLALVVHDWGGLIGLRVAVENPERVARLVILDTGVWSGRAPSETWLRFREALRSVGGELDVGRLVAAALERVRDGLARWDKPAHVIWGAEDAVLPTAIAERFVSLIPGATGPETIPGAGHFLQEDTPVEVATAIARALN